MRPCYWAVRELNHLTERLLCRFDDKLSFGLPLFLRKEDAEADARARTENDAWPRTVVKVVIEVRDFCDDDEPREPRPVSDAELKELGMTREELDKE